MGEPRCSSSSGASWIEGALGAVAIRQVPFVRVDRVGCNGERVCGREGAMPYVSWHALVYSLLRAILLLSPDVCFLDLVRQRLWRWRPGHGLGCGRRARYGIVRLRRLGSF